MRGLLFCWLVALTGRFLFINSNFFTSQKTVYILECLCEAVKALLLAILYSPTLIVNDPLRKILKAQDHICET